MTSFGRRIYLPFFRFSAVSICPVHGRNLLFPCKSAVQATMTGEYVFNHSLGYCPENSGSGFTWFFARHLRMKIKPFVVVRQIKDSSILLCSPERRNKYTTSIDRNGFFLNNNNNNNNNNYSNNNI